MEALLGVIIGGVIAIIGQIYTTHSTLREARLKTRQDFLIARMTLLASALAEYEEYLARFGLEDGDKLEHAKIIGKAIAACLSVSDLPSPSDIPDTDIQYPDKIPELPYHSGGKVHKIHRLAYIANERLTRNFVKKGDGPQQAKECEIWGPYQDRNRHALDHAVKRLAQLIGETQKDQTTDYSFE